MFKNIKWKNKQNEITIFGADHSASVSKAFRTALVFKALATRRHSSASSLGDLAMLWWISWTYHGNSYGYNGHNGYNGYNGNNILYINGYNGHNGYNGYNGI